MAEPDDSKETELIDDSASRLEDDPRTDAAVEAIIRSEGDDELRNQDEAVEDAIVMQSGLRAWLVRRWSGWWGDPHKKWETMVVTAVVLAALSSVPFMRYELAGLFIHEGVTVTVIDSKTEAPVSGVQVQLGTAKSETNATGMAVLYPRTGSMRLQVNKLYYRGSTQTVLVTLSPGHNFFKVKLVALGRRVQLKIINKITDLPLANADINAGGADAKTNQNGLATVILPSAAETQSASVMLNGYNASTIRVAATGDQTKNTFGITPIGKLYFLSDSGGTIDVVKTNLDGTDKETVLAGTGDENPNTTQLIVSPDWRYVALLSQRSGSVPSLYLIDTTNGDKLTTIAQGNVTLTPIGWSSSRFIYEVDKSATVPDWQPYQEDLESFDPATGQTLLLDQTQASGSGEGDYLKQAFGPVYIMSSKIVYTKSWFAAAEADALNRLNTQQAEIDTIGPDGSDHQVVQTFSYPGPDLPLDFELTTSLYALSSLHIEFTDGRAQPAFYDYINGAVTSDTTMNSDTFAPTEPYPTYLVSPNNDLTFWSVQSGSSNALFVGDANGQNQKQITNLDSYTPYGWYTDDYLLLTNSDSNALYIMPAGGGEPLKVGQYDLVGTAYTGGGGY